MKFLKHNMNSFIPGDREIVPAMFLLLGLSLPTRPNTLFKPSNKLSHNTWPPLQSLPDFASPVQIPPRLSCPKSLGQSDPFQGIILGSHLHHQAGYY